MNQTPTSRDQAVLALVLDEVTRARSTGQEFSTENEAFHALTEELTAFRDIRRGNRPGLTVKQRKSEVAARAVRIAALWVRVVLDLRLDRYLDLKPPVRPMSRSRRFEKGEPVPSLAAAVAEIEAGRWLIVGDKPQSPKWLINASLVTLRRDVRYGRLFYAIDLKAAAGRGL